MRDVVSDALCSKIQEWAAEKGYVLTDEQVDEMLKGVHFWFQETVNDSISTAYDCLEIPFSAQPLAYTDEQMRDHLEFKGYTVGDSLDLMAKANALGFEFDEDKERWLKGVSAN